MTGLNSQLINKCDGMNILYVSHIPARVTSGPSWSVPASVDAQSNVDNVLWVNTKEDTLPHWEKVNCFHKLSEYGSLSLKNMPHPFDKPDVVVFEGLYDSFKEISFSCALRKAKIPYIIVPRGSLTYNAMHNGSKIKKEIAHKLFYDNYISKALAIQFLTNREYEDSKYRFDGKHFILPNGIHPSSIVKEDFSSNGIRAVYIGRFDAYHKGLDLLLEACKAEKDYLVNNGFLLSLYGTETADWHRLKENVSKWGSEFIQINKSIFGKDKENVLLSSDIFVMTSRFEGHPMGLIEALAYGLPCLASNGTNMSSEVSKYNAGWTCQSDVSSIRQALHSIIDEHNSFLERSKNALKLSSLYNWDKLAVDFHNQVKSILS